MHNLQSKLNKWTREKTYTEREDKICYTELFPDYRLRPSIGSNVEIKIQSWKYCRWCNSPSNNNKRLCKMLWHQCKWEYLVTNMFQAWQSCTMLWKAGTPIINTFQGCFQRSSCDESDGMTTYGHMKSNGKQQTYQKGLIPHRHSKTNFHNMWVFKHVTNKSWWLVGGMGSLINVGCPWNNKSFVSYHKSD